MAARSRSSGPRKGGGRGRGGRGGQQPGLDAAQARLFSDCMNFDSYSWLGCFSGNAAGREWGKVKHCRRLIYETTCDALEGLQYGCDGEVVQIDPDSIQLAKDAQTQLFGVDELEVDKALGKEGKIQVIDSDTIAAGLALLAEGFNPVVLNMASPRRPGGGVRGGAGAQEENLFRRTALPVVMVAEPEGPLVYKTPPFSAIYSPYVPVIRGTEDEGYPFLPEPIPLSFVAVAAIPKPPMRGNKLTDAAAETTMRKIRCILNTAVKKDHDAVVLSAFGCGAFGNPPVHMASLFREVIEAEYSEAFDRIVFAIIDDHNSKGNLASFQNVFGDIAE